MYTAISFVFSFLDLDLLTFVYGLWSYWYLGDYSSVLPTILGVTPQSATPAFFVSLLFGAGKYATRVHTYISELTSLWNQIDFGLVVSVSQLRNVTFLSLQVLFCHKVEFNSITDSNLSEANIDSAVLNITSTPVTNTRDSHNRLLQSCRPF